VGPKAVLDAVVKRKIPSPRRESNPRTPIVRPVAQRYTDRVITALGEWSYSTTKSLTSAIDGGEWSASRPGRFTLRERNPTKYFRVEVT
jgi:hypothetical protein